MAHKQKIRKNYKQKPSSSEEMVKAIVHEGSLERRSETTGEGLVKQVGFKPGVKVPSAMQCCLASFISGIITLQHNMQHFAHLILNLLD